MVPDFQNLRQQACDHTEPDHLKLKADRPFSKSKTFQNFSDLRNSPTKPTPKKKSAKAFQYVPEALNEFLALWPHRYDFLYAPHPNPGQKPDWKTESRYLLSDRLIDQGIYLYGIRHGATTSYGMLDIDSGSPYHPKRDPLAIQRICQALEPLGLVADLKLTSSDSLGLHIYYPFSDTVPSWQLALAIATLLENAGFKLVPGWLEIFPNRKAFSADGSYSLFNGHRLPLQHGSYLLNDDLQPIASSQQAFVRQWQQAAAHNDISTPVLEQIIRQAQRKAYRVTGKAEKFLNDLNAEIEPGWSGPGQTNYILGRITMRSYIFGHIIGAEAPLNGKALVNDIVKVARALPGFEDYCGHQKELVKKAKEWAQSIESKKRYFPYATGKAFKTPQEPTWNEQQASEAREHIRLATLELCKQNAFPNGITPRFILLCSCHISGETLYRNKDLWHPVFICEQQKKLMESALNASTRHLKTESACAGGAADSAKDTSLLGATGRNKPNDKASSDSSSLKSRQILSTGRNKPNGVAFSPTETGHSEQPIERSQPPEQLSLNIQWALQVANSKRREQIEANRQRYQQDKRQRAQAEHRAQMYQWIDSGDPILVAEAERQLDRVARGLIDQSNQGYRNVNDDEGA